MSSTSVPFGSHELDSSIDYPHFPDKERQKRISSLPIRVLLRVVGGISIAIGLIGAASAPFYFSRANIQRFDFPGVDGQTAAEFWLDIGSRIALYLLVGTLLFLIARAAKKRNVQLDNEIASLAQSAIASERERLQEIKKHMTVAEWESYKLQMENQRLLKQIKNRPVQTKTTTTTTFGYVED